MKRFIALVLCAAMLCQMSVSAFAAETEIIPYDPEAVIDIEFPGFYDAEQDRIVLYEELRSNFIAGTLSVGAYAVIGGIVFLSTWFTFQMSGANEIRSRALTQMVSNALNNASDACILFMQEVGEMFIKGKAITNEFLQSGADYISELKDAVVMLVQTEDETFSFTKGSAGSLAYVVESGALTLSSTWPSSSDLSKHTTQPWLYASATGAALWMARKYYSNSSTTYYWHGLSSDEFGEYWYYFEASSLYGYSSDNINYNSYVSIPDGVALHKFYLSSQSAYNAAVAAGTGSCYFLQANSKLAYTYKSTSKYDYAFKAGSYSYAGSLTENYIVWTGVNQTNWSPTYNFAPATESVVVDVTVTDTESTITSIPDGLVLDNAATEAEIDIDALAYRVADILSNRLAGTEKDEAAEAEKQGILQNIYQTVIALPDAIANALGGSTVVEDVEALAPVQVVQDKFVAIGLIYNVVAGFLERITSDVEPPVIYVDMTKSKSQFITSDNDKIPILDMSFYEPYKPYGDTIISGILWTFFLWRLFSRLPDIISGAGMVAESGLSLEDRKASVKDRREKRSKKGG